MPGAAGFGPPFDLRVAPDGYAWWYLDATSRDGRHGLTLIAFVGSVFSPYYAAARRRRGNVDPQHHCAINVAFYGDVRRWAMTERDAGALRRTDREFRLGPSRMRWQDGVLEIDVDEVTVPWPSRLRGRIRVQPETTTDLQVNLDPAGRHRWQPIAPRARVDLEFGTPALRWSGHGYLDSNRGDEPLESAFTEWHWSRAQTSEGDTRVCYDVARRDGTTLALGVSFDRAGQATAFEPPPAVPLSPTLWRIERSARVADLAAHSLRAVEDTPFYARSMTLPARPGAAQVVHESLWLDRFTSTWVQALLPFRMWRRRSPRDG
jgi:carotenoid 1,2-hydratase